MLLFFGIRATRIDALELINCECPHCHSQNTLTATKYGRYFHFFFIPIFPTSEKTFVECSHCYKTFNGSSFEKKNVDGSRATTALIETKRPLWHSCGCLLIVLVFAFGMISTCAGHLLRDDKKEKENPLEKEYNKDYDRLTSTPDCKTDSVSCAIKNYFDMVMTDELNKKNFKYFSKVSGSKVLILVQIDDMKKIKSSSRYQLIDEIKKATQFLDNMENKEYYIGVDGRWNLVLAESPNESDLGGTFASESILYDFYAKNDTIKNKEKL